MALRVFKCTTYCLSSPCYVTIEDDVGNVLLPTACPFSVEGIDRAEFVEMV